MCERIHSPKALLNFLFQLFFLCSLLPVSSLLRHVVCFSEASALDLSLRSGMLPARTKMAITATAQPIRRVLYTWSLYYELLNAAGLGLCSFEWIDTATLQLDYSAAVIAKKWHLCGFGRTCGPHLTLVCTLPCCRHASIFF